MEKEKEDLEYFEQKRVKFNETNVFMSALGIEITALRQGYAEAKLTTGRRHRNTSGNVHGGVLFTMADSVTGAASKTYGHQTTTIEGKINYLRAVSIDHEILTATANVLHAGRKTIVIECRITDSDGNLVAAMLYTYYALDQAF